MQSRTSSLIEAGINILIGFTINYIANLIILPMFGYTPSLSDNFYIGLMYTAVSLVRQYVIRRWFNARIHAAAQKMAGEAA